MRIKSSNGSLKIQVLVEQIFHRYEESFAQKSFPILTEREEERLIIFLEMWSNEQVWAAAKKVFA